MEFTQRGFEAGQRILDRRSNLTRKQNGQFLTPPPLARYMADQLGTIADGDHILDPALGSGTLLCAVIDRLIAENRPLEIWMDGFELDCELLAVAESVLREAIVHAAVHDVIIHLRLFQADFVLNGLHFLRPSLLDVPVGQSHYQHIIANPPYFKIGPNDPRRVAADGVLSGQTNIYTLFVGMAARMLHGGTACFVVPRSFCSGAYFARFRRDFLRQVSVRRVHLLETRDTTFNNVLQENVVLTFTPPDDCDRIEVSSSTSVGQIDTSPRPVSRQHFVGPLDVLRLPTSAMDEAILNIVDDWDESLDSYNMTISTGPVVPFRAEEYLTHGPEGVPLLWMQHVRPQQVTWPLKLRKPQYILPQPSLVVENTNYVLLRRFSAKEETRRLVAAPYLAHHFAYDRVGLENHLNYIYCRDRAMRDDEAYGLSALFNSGLIDRYFRISNGNTQVNAAELRMLPLPPLPVIAAIGVARFGDDLDAIVVQTLQAFGLLPDDFPVLRETRVL